MSMINFTVMFFGNLIYLPDVPILFRPNIESQVDSQPDHFHQNQDVSVFNDATATPDWNRIGRWLSSFSSDESNESNDSNAVAPEFKKLMSSYQDLGKLIEKVTIKIDSAIIPKPSQPNVFSNIDQLKLLYHDYHKSSAHKDERLKDYSIEELKLLDNYNRRVLIAIGSLSVITQDNIVELIENHDENFDVYCTNLLCNPHFLTRIPDGEFDRLFYIYTNKFRSLSVCVALKDRYLARRMNEQHITSLIQSYSPLIKDRIFNRYVSAIFESLVKNPYLFRLLKEHHVVQFLDYLVSIGDDLGYAYEALRTPFISILSDEKLDFYLLQSGVHDNYSNYLDINYIIWLLCNPHLKDYFSRMNESKLVFLFEMVCQYYDSLLTNPDDMLVNVINRVRYMITNLKIIGFLDDRYLFDMMCQVKNEHLRDILLDIIDERNGNV